MADEAAAELAGESARRMYAADRASRSLGIEITEVAPGRATATMRISAEMVNGHGIAHGGFVFLLADTAFAFACNTYGEATVARAADIAFVAPVHEDDALIAVAAERSRSGRNGVYDVTVRRSEGDVVAEFRGHSRGLGRPLAD